jgi:hypothetical protein
MKKGKKNGIDAHPSLSRQSLQTASIRVSEKHTLGEIGGCEGMRSKERKVGMGKKQG